MLSSVALLSLPALPPSVSFTPGVPGWLTPPLAHLHAVEPASLSHLLHIRTHKAGQKTEPLLALRNILFAFSDACMCVCVRADKNSLLLRSATRFGF